jgi:hypothetical protein
METGSLQTPSTAIFFSLNNLHRIVMGREMGPRGGFGVPQVSLPRIMVRWPLTFQNLIDRLNVD